MKIGAFVPQGWRMDLNGVAQDNQWQTILDAANKIENLNLNHYGYMIIFTLFLNLHKILLMNVGH